MSFSEIYTSLEIGLIYGIVAMGIYFAFRIIDFSDLTCDGSFVLGAAVSAVALKYGLNPYFALVLAICFGGLAGLCTGIINIYFKVTPILAGILTAFMLYSINLKIMQGTPNIALINELTIFTNTNTLITLSLICFAIWGLASLLLMTNFGLALRSCGQNKRLSLNNGVKINYMLIAGLVISNALIACGGALFSQHQGFVDVSQGIGTIIIGLAAVMLGERLLPFRSTWILLIACLLGSFVYRLLISIALHNEILGLATEDLNLITGVMLIAIMLLPRRRCAQAT